MFLFPPFSQGPWIPRSSPSLLDIQFIFPSRIPSFQSIHMLKSPQPKTKTIPSSNYLFLFPLLPVGRGTTFQGYLSHPGCEGDPAEIDQTSPMPVLILILVHSFLFFPLFSQTEHCAILLAHIPSRMWRRDCWGFSNLLSKMSIYSSTGTTIKVQMNPEKKLWLLWSKQEAQT